MKQCGWIISAVFLLLSTASIGQSSKEAVLYNFQGFDDGAAPTGTLIADAAGNLYGTTTNGGMFLGTVFKLSPASGGGWIETILHTFSSLADGARPYGGLILDEQGNLFGTTSTGGTNDVGTVYELSPSADGSWTKTTIVNFTGTSDGGDPLSGLVRDGSGNFYGVTSGGGTSGQGTVFRLQQTALQTWSETVLYSFGQIPDGNYPLQALVLDKAGNLYGTTRSGGSGGCSGEFSGCGMVFELSHTPDFSHWKEVQIHSFSGADGSTPWDGSLVFDGNGNLYGTTYAGGPNNAGVAFELSRHAGQWTETILYSFVGNPTGFRPVGGLAFDSFRNLYGTTANGGAAGFGTVFKLRRSGAGWVHSIVHSLVYSDGAYPDGLLIDTHNRLYGTTFDGGFGVEGVVYRITP